MDEDDIEVLDDGSPQPLDQNDDDLEWEDADEPGLQEPGGEGQAAAAAAAEAADGGFEITLDGPSGKKSAPRAAPKGRTVTKADRELTLGVHRAYVICQMGRAIQLDSAASRRSILIAARQALPDDVIPDFQPGGGPKAYALRKIVSWFKSEFKVCPLLPKGVSALEYRPPRSALSARDFYAQLLSTALQRREGSEQVLASLFAALLRSLGLMVRTVHVLQALPRTPTAQEDHLTSLWAAEGGQGKGGLAGHKRSAPEAGLTRSAREIIEGARKRARQENVLVQPAASAQKTLAKALAASPQNAGPFSAVVLKGDLLEQLQLEMTLAVSRAEAEGSEDDPPGPSVRRAAAATPKGKAAKEKRPRKAAAVNKATPGGAKGKKSPGAAAAAAAAAAARPQGDDSDEVVVVEDNSEPGPSAPPAAAGKRATRLGNGTVASKRYREDDSSGGEEEEEEKEGDGGRSEGEPGGSGRGKGGEGGAKAAKGGKRATTGKLSPELAAAEPSSSEPGGPAPCPNYWVEVLCGDGEAAQWVHVDPLRNWIDTPTRVAAAPRPPGAPLCYVLALHPLTAGGSGTKDVTQRYAHAAKKPGSGPLAADKVRDGPWFHNLVLDTRRPALSDADYDLDGLGVGVGGSVGSAAAAAAAAGAGPSNCKAGGERGGGSTVQGGGAAAARAAPANWASAQKWAQIREDNDLFGREASKAKELPTSIDGFKKHPDLILERHIGRYEALAPGTQALGAYRGESYFPRAALSPLHTAERWRREGRQVKEEELEKPCKVVAKRKQGEAGGGGGGGRGRGRGRGGRGRGAQALPPAEEGPEAGNILDEELGLGPAAEPVDGTKLYGEWQTDPYALPQAENGLVPKTERGQVECPPFTHALPGGTVHLRGLERGIAGRVCRRLNVDYAPAMVGFEPRQRAGGAVPSFDGIVVCSEFEASVLEEYAKERAEQDRKEAERRSQVVVDRWKDMVKGLLARAQVQALYGENADRSKVEEEEAARARDKKRARSGGKAAAAGPLEENEEEDVGPPGKAVRRGQETHGNRAAAAGGAKPGKGKANAPAGGKAGKGAAGRVKGAAAGRARVRGGDHGGADSGSEGGSEAEDLEPNDGQRKMHGGRIVDCEEI